MGHIFISYSRQDQDLVDKIIRVLAKAGAKVWIDREGIAGGVKWRRQIVEAIADADAVLLALSPNSVKSDNVRKELDLTEEFKKTILPVEMERTPIPRDLSYQLVGLQRIDLVTDFDAGVRQLLHALGLPTESSPQTEGIGGVQPTAATPESQYRQGQKLYSAGEHALALQCFREAAERGHAASQNALGCMYYWGYGAVVDYPEALKWFRRAAEQGEVWAYYHLGKMYQLGSGVPKDTPQAIRYLRKAAEAGVAEAQVSLGVIYRMGTLLHRLDPSGPEEDFGEAEKWYRKAADQGNASAMENLAELYHAGGVGVPEDQAKEDEWNRKCEEQRKKDRNAPSEPLR